MDDAYIANLYQEVTALYHLDQQGTGNGEDVGGRADLGPLPGTAVMLLSVLAAAWILILLYLLWGRVKENKKKH